MYSDKQLQQDVLDELDWEPSVDAAHIGVSVENGIATLSGHVLTYSEKHGAEMAARRVKGVRAVVQEIEVRLSTSAERSDEDIAASVLSRLAWQSGLPSERVKVEVENGTVTLCGEVDWKYQSELAVRNAGAVHGVRAVINSIAIRPSAEPADVKRRIEQALRRHAELEASRISVSAVESTVTLTGTVNSLYERQMAERAAWSAPGVRHVIDRIAVAN